MSFDDLEDILGAIAAPFDDRISAKGGEIEAALPAGKRLLVDDLDALHWSRAEALANVAYEVGLAVGKRIGLDRTRSGGDGGTRLSEDPVVWLNHDDQGPTGVGTGASGRSGGSASARLSR